MDELNSECKEYNAINYRRIVNNGMNIPIKKKNISIEELNNFLMNDIEINKNDSWTKLTKPNKKEKINHYMNTIKDSKNLNDNEFNSLKKIINKLIEKKKLNKTCEVVYSKENGNILSIPGIIFNETDRVFNYIVQQKKGTKKKN